MLRLRGLTSSFQQPGQPVRMSNIVTRLSPLTTRPISLVGVARVLTRGGPVARLGGRYSKVANKLDLSSDGLVGLVDLHTHPAAHLGFGTNLFYGPPDGDPSQVFNDCRAYHGGWDALSNPHGNDIRNQIVNHAASTDYSGNWSDNWTGWPNFPDWPTWHDRLHQQLRVEMLERAWDGGLRVVVALAVNSHTLAFLAQTAGPYDDKPSGDQQIAAIKEMVAGQHFTELAQSPADLRAIVGRGHLAVVLGVELDCLGNFYQPGRLDGSTEPLVPQPTPDAVKAEVQRLHDLGVRYVFPVHLTDNVFGGAALYDMSFDVANHFQFGGFFTPETAPPESEIGYHITQASFWDDVVANATVLLSLGFDPAGRPAPPPGFHRNSRGLQPLGGNLLDALMALGMMIDVDHMSEKTMRDTFAHTAGSGYPVFAGHCGLRPPPSAPGTPNPNANERSHQASDAAVILGRGGMWGVGIKGGIGAVGSTIQQLRQGTPTGGGIGFGSDCSGLEQLPAPRGGDGVGLPTDTTVTAQQAESLHTVVYRDLVGAPPDALTRAQLGQRRDGIYWTGFQHVGMYPDFIEDGISSGLLTAPGDPSRPAGMDDLTQLFQAPEAFARAWAACLAAAGLPPGP